MAKRVRSNQAQAATMIRKHLKATYPHTTFSVTSCGFAGGDAVDIVWADGPTTQEVERYANQFQSGSVDIPQVKYIQTQRGHSAAAYRDMVSILNAYWRWNLVIDEICGYNVIIDGDHHHGNGWASQEIYRKLMTYSLVCTECKAATLPSDKFCPQCGASVAQAEDRKIA